MGCRPFQAPEFFTEPVRYGFKSDVFPLGLICGAMTQAVPKLSLQPLADSDPDISIIGLAVLTDPGLVVLEKREEDGQLLKEFKDLTRTMLKVAVEDRVSSTEAQAQLASLLEVLNYNHSLVIFASVCNTFFCHVDRVFDRIGRSVEVYAHANE